MALAHVDIDDGKTMGQSGEREQLARDFCRQVQSITISIALKQ